MTFELRPGAPLYPIVTVLLALSAVGIVFVVFSRNTALKRGVFPVTLGAFSVAAYLVVYGGGQLHTNLAKIGIGLALAANAIWVHHIIQFCRTCGATAARGVMASGLCPECAGPRPS